jgi:hypothetical protein
MRRETIDLEPNGFPASHHATFGKQIPDISHARREPMASPDRAGDNFTRVTTALLARHCRGYFHAPPGGPVSKAEQLGNAHP